MKTHQLLIMTSLLLGTAQAAAFEPANMGLISRTSTDGDGNKTAIVKFAVYSKPDIKGLLAGCLNYYAKDKDWSGYQLTCRAYRTERFANAFDVSKKNSDNCWLLEATKQANKIIFKKNSILNTSKCYAADR